MLPINLLFSAGKGIFSAWSGHRKAKIEAVKSAELADLARGKQVKTGWQVAFDTLVFATIFGPFLISLTAILKANDVLVTKMSMYFEHIGNLNAEYWYLAITVITLIYGGRTANLLMKGKK